MKTSRVLILFFLLFLIFSNGINTHAILNLHEGTYATYALLEPEGGPGGVKDLYMFILYPEGLPPNVRNRLIGYLSPDSPWIKDGFPFIIGDCTEVFLEFEILKVLDNTASINVSITFVNTTLEGDYRRIIPNLTIWEVLDLNFSDMTYYENGTPIGKATLFIDPSDPPKPGEVLFSLEGLSMDVNVSVGNVTYSAYGNSTVLTYYRPFRPPHIGMTTRRFYFSEAGKNWSISGGGREEYTYDFLTGVMIAGTFSHSTELMALGVFDIDSMDRRIRGKSEDGVWPDGIKLYDTNIAFPDEGDSSYPDSPWRYYMYSGILALMASLLARWWKDGHG